ncbi:MAG: ImmA/IrrE family metallo-endopeptidase [Burkholderiaceae bacterium]|jgi:Zn-dependent peptidase ImmA (M78 family)|nr:MAG: ImmA/IrrE family metallo-endopeptidase [Burkholderiaceae bacterium]
MIARGTALKVARLAAEVLANPHTRARLADGYTRVDPIAIAEDEGINVMVRPLDKLLGAFLREDSVGILLNHRRPAGMFHMTCAHELGHFFLGHGTNTDEQLDYGSGANVIELEADQFAYSLMAPLALVVKALKAQRWNWESVRNPATIYQLSLRLGLSYTAMVWSLVRLGKLDGGTARSLARIPPANIKRALAPEGTTFEGNQDVWRIGPNDGGSILEPRPDDHIIMELPSHVTSGYLWTVTEAQAEGYALKPLLIDSREQPPVDTSPDVLVGNTAPMSYSLELPRDSITAPVQVVFDEVQPWSGASRHSEGGSSTFALRTQLEEVEKGLSASTRQRLIQEAKAQ